MGLTVTSTALAIDGGAPVRESFLPFGMPCLGEEEIQEVVATLQSGWIGTGPRNEQFEREFASHVGAAEAVSLNSCTAGLFLSLRCLGVGEGDAVLTTPLTFAATANVIEHVGALPVFVDIDPLTLNIDPLQVEAVIQDLLQRSSGKNASKPKAIIPVHFAGLPCEMDALHELAEKHGLHVIEDAAHALGSFYHGRPVGCISEVTCFSLYANKPLTSVEGGMITTDCAELAENLRIWRLHGLSSDAWKRFGKKRLDAQILFPGYKCNLPDVLAAIGLQQLRKQEEFLRRREMYASLYDAAFARLPLRRQPRTVQDAENAGPGEEERHALHLYVLILSERAFSASRDQIVDALLAENIGAAVHHRPLHMQPWYEQTYGYKPSDYPNAAQAGANIFTLPLSPAMTEDDVWDVVEAVHKVLRVYRR
jgi:dTDP-4-amino-4,6-dideoxygalactose transaminase